MFLLLAEVVALAAFALFFTPVGWATVAGVFLADVGICAVGVLLSAMAAAGRARELLLPLLFLPLALPIVIGGVGASVADEPGPLPGVPRALRRDLRAARLGLVRVRRHGVKTALIASTWRWSVPQQPPTTSRLRSCERSSR